MRTSVNPEEIEHFAKDSSQWWDESGPFAILHRLNPLRLRYIRDQIGQHFDRDVTNLNPLTGLKILDVGCGGGLICEPMARMGASVTGIDADTNAIAIAHEHSQKTGMSIEYQATTAEDIQAKTIPNGGFDVVLAIEIVEHVADLEGFVKSCAALCRPGGLLIFSTLNRTTKSYILGIIAAENILRWVPRGTHDWKKFIRPSEMSREIRNAGCTAKDIKGYVFNPLSGEFHLSDKDMSVNYFITAEK